MDPLSANELKRFATQTARILTEEGGDRAVELMYRLGLLEGPASNHRPQAALAPGAGPRQRAKDGWVGIWEPQNDGRFVRSSEWLDEWALWANVPTIAAKGTKKRVAFLGESVARGFHYDPRYTPAQALGAMLGTAGVAGGVEVVDLARTSLEADHLVELLGACVHLEPDAVVIFAGNNWLEDSRPVDRLEHHLAAVVLRESGVPGLKAHFERRLASRVAGHVQEVGSFTRNTGIPVVLVVPEFNLLDWIHETPQAPWIPGDGNVRWLELLGSAEEALGSDRVTEAAARASEMIELDGGTAAAGLTLLAECMKRQGSLDEARRLLERARDAHIWDIAPQSPRALAVVNDVLRGEAEREKLSIVDLPRVFRDRLAGELADRRLFLDYCHLSSEGIRVAMAATAESVATVLGGFFESGSGEAAAPDGDVESEAHFAAAIHNAHYGQPYEIVRFHCSRAIEESAKINDVMLRYIDMQARRAPMWICDATAQLGDLSTAGLRRYILSYTTTPLPKLFDRVLLDAMADSLTEAGTAARERLDDLRLDEHGVGEGKPVDLLDPRYAPSWFHRDWWLWAGPPAREGLRYHYYKAYSPASGFQFVSRCGGPVVLKLTCRGVDAAGGECRVVVNGDPVKAIALEDRWRTAELVVPAGSVRKGVNAVEVRWPTSGLSYESGIDAAARRLDASELPSLLPVFGHIHSLTASVGTEPAGGG